MHGLLSVAWRSLSARPVRTLTSIAGIGLGVAVLAATIATNLGVDRAVGETVRDILGGASLRVGAFEERGLTDPTIQVIRETPGVIAAAPAIERRTYLGPASSAADPVTVLGVDPSAEAGLHPFELVDGSALSGGDGATALVAESLARPLGLGVGDAITLLGAGPPTEFTIAGLLAGDGPAHLVPGPAVVIGLADARRLFDAAGVTRIDLALAPGTSADAAIEALDARLTREPYTISTAADLDATLRGSTAEIQVTMALLAAVALFASSLLIFNTLSMTVTERVREVGLLRAAGATRGQVNAMVLVQATVLGLAGSIVGLGLGLGLARLVSRQVQGAATGLSGIVPSIEGGLLAAGLGLAVTLAAALEPAWRAGRISPVEALRSRIDPAAGLRARLRWLVLVIGVVGVVGAAAWPVGIDLRTGLRPLLVYGFLAGLALAIPLILRPLGLLAGILFRPLFRTEERLSRGGLAHDPSRTTVTIGALMVGLAMVVAVQGVAGATRRTATEWITSVMPGDVVVRAVVPQALDESGPTLDLAAVAGVARVTPIGSFAVAFLGQRLDGAAVSGAGLLGDGRLTFRAGNREVALRRLDEGGAVIVPAAQADRLGLVVGDVLQFTTSTGPVELRIVGIVDRSIPGGSGEAVLIGWSDALDRFGVLGADLFAVRLEPGATSASRSALESIAGELALQVSTLDDLQGSISGALGRVFGLFDTLALIALFVAGLGIVNTLTMNVAERIREIGVLRATGMTRRQVWRMVVVEAGVLGTAGAILGCLAGLAVTLILVGPASLATAAVSVPWPTLVLAAIFGIVVAMLAAAWPARVASRVSIVRAVQLE